MENYEKLIMGMLKGETPKEKYDRLVKIIMDLHTSIDFLKAVEKAYMFDTDVEGNVTTDFNELIKMWVNIENFLKKYK